MAANNFLQGASGGRLLTRNKPIGKALKRRIKDAGFNNLKHFKEQTGFNRKTTTRADINNALNAGFNPQPAETTQPAQPPAQPVDATPSVGEGLVNQATDITNVGGRILNTGNSQQQNIVNQANNLANLGTSNLDQVNEAVGNVRGQGQNIIDTINANTQAARADVNNLFNAGRLQDFKSEIGDLSANLNNQGTRGSRSGIEMEAELQRRLLRDSANANLNVNERGRQAIENELGQQRGAEAGIANLMSGQGSTLANLGLQGSTQAGSLENATNQLGANIFNQGLNNQLGIFNTLNNAEMQRFTIQNQLLQQALANIMGSRQNRRTNQITQRQLDLAEQLQGGGSTLGNILGGALPGFMGG